MLYDIFIFGLTALGIVTVVTFSVKIARSKVYPVGIVRKRPVSKQLPAEATIEAVFQARRELVATEMDYLAAYYDESSNENLWWRWNRAQIDKIRAKPSMNWGLSPWHKNPNRSTLVITNPSSDVTMWSIATGVPPREEEKTRLETKVAELEKRIRQLEVETVKKSQDAAKEKQQEPQQAEYLH